LAIVNKNNLKKTRTIPPYSTNINEKKRKKIIRMKEMGVDECI